MAWKPIVAAAIVGGAGAALTTFFFLAVLKEEPPSFMPGLIGVGLGMTTAHFVRVMTAPADTADGEEEDSTSEAQAVGQSCAVCADKIRVTRNAAECDDCGGVFHDDCFDDHACA